MTEYSAVRELVYMLDMDVINSSQAEAINMAIEALEYIEKLREEAEYEEV